MKRKSKKTIHRETRMPGIESYRRVTNKLNTKKTRELSLGFSLERTRAKRLNKTRPVISYVNPVSSKITVYEQNLYVLKSLGYRPKETRFNVKMKRIDKEQQRMMYDVLGCRKRRKLTRMLEREQVVTYKRIA
jgi:hypothetical protein